MLSPKIDKFNVTWIERELGKNIEVISMVTGKTHIVPRRYIAENGLKHSDLEKFPIKKPKEK